jgi:hypothetical protein
MFAKRRLKFDSMYASLTRRGCCPWVVAICGVFAIPAAAAVPAVPAESRNSTADPQSLSAELTAELQLVYRDNLPEFTRRSEQLRQAIAAWSTSAKSSADRTQMAEWLHQAIRASMPGSTKSLPPVPSFAPAEIKPSQSNSKPSQPNLPASVLVAKPAAPQSPPAAIAPTRIPIPQQQKQPAAAETSPNNNDGDPFRDDAAPDHANNGDDHATPAPPIPSPSPQSMDGSVRIRLQELAPRIQGFEMALRGMDAKLIAGKLRASELAQLSTKLDELSDQRRFLALYVGALTPAEQQQIPALRPLEPTTRLLAQCVAEQQAALLRASTDDADPKRSQELATLDRLASELKQNSAMHASAK